MFEAIRAISLYSAGLNARTFAQNNLVKDACLMQFQHLWETANKCKTYFPDDEQLPYRDMIGFRNFIAHDYIGIDIEEVWETIEKDLPALKVTLEQILLAD